MSSPPYSPRSVHQRVLELDVVSQDSLSLNQTQNAGNPPDPPDNGYEYGGNGGGEGQEEEIPGTKTTPTGMHLHVIPPIDGPRLPVSNVTFPSPSPFPNPRRKANKRKKGKKNIRRKQSMMKFQSLIVKLNPLPFIPLKIPDFFRHEKLLKKLGLWDFVHVDFDRNIREDLIAQLVATYDRKSKCSYVNGFRIALCRVDFAHAFKFPLRKKANAGDMGGVVLDEDSIGFIVDFVSDWVLLHDDIWMMPPMVVHWLKLIEDGHPANVDWAELLRFMVEKELMQGDKLRDCYYASHLQCLLKFKRGELFFLESGVAEKVDLEVETVEELEKANEGCFEVETAEVPEEANEGYFEVETAGELEKANKGYFEVETAGELEEANEGHFKVETKEEPKDTNEGYLEVETAEEPEEEGNEGYLEVETAEEPEEANEGYFEVETAQEQEKANEGYIKVETAEEREKANEGYFEVETAEEPEEANEGYFEVEAMKEPEDANKGDSIFGGAFDDQEEDCCAMKGPSIELTLGYEHQKDENVKDANLVDVEKEKSSDCVVFLGDGGEDEYEEEGDGRDDMEGGEEAVGWISNGKNNLGERFMHCFGVEDAQGFCSLENRKYEHEEIERNRGKDGSPRFDVFLTVDDDDFLDGEGVTGEFHQAMETNQAAFKSQEHLSGPSSMDIRDVMQHEASTPHFFNHIGKRVKVHDDDASNHPLTGSNKRLRMNDSWNYKPLDFATCMEQIQQTSGRAAMMFAAKEQELEHSNMNQHGLFSEIQNRDKVIEHLRRAKFGEIQKKDREIYRLERELYLMENVMDGYRKALKDTHKLFAEYRQRGQLSEEPTDKDAGPGGLMLSSSEIEKIHEKKDDYKMNCLVLEQKMKEAEENYCRQFDEYVDKIDSFDMKLGGLEAEAKKLIQMHAEQKLPQTEEKLSEVAKPFSNE